MLKNKIRVVITGEDFVISNYINTSNCALAKALRRELGDEVGIAVGGCSVTINSGNKKTEYYIPYRHQNTIRKRCVENIRKDLIVILTKE